MVRLRKRGASIILVSTGSILRSVRATSRGKASRRSGPSLTAITLHQPPRRVWISPAAPETSSDGRSNCVCRNVYFVSTSTSPSSMAVFRGSTLVAVVDRISDWPFSSSHSSSCSHGYWRFLHEPWPQPGSLGFSLISRTYADAGTAMCRSFGCLATASPRHRTASMSNVETRDRFRYVPSKSSRAASNPSDARPRGLAVTCVGSAAAPARRR